MDAGVDGTTGRLLKDARLLLRLSLAKVSQASGVDSGTISRYENGLLPVPPATVDRIRAALIAVALEQQAAAATTKPRRSVAEPEIARR